MNDPMVNAFACPFCLPDTQRNSFASSVSFLAIYNQAPILPGHTLIIPRMHVKSLRSLTNDQMAEFFLFAREVTEMLLQYYLADAFDWSIQDNESAGQTVAHLHLHIVVRHPADLPDPGDWYPLLDAKEKTGSENRPHLSSQEYSEITRRLSLAYIERRDHRI
jgi:bis(5'-adenosyl)-triphosphatase